MGVADGSNLGWEQALSTLRGALIGVAIGSLVIPVEENVGAAMLTGVVGLCALVVAQQSIGRESA